MFAACVKVLSAWGWARAPGRRGDRRLAAGGPTLVGSFGQRISSIGRLPLLGTVWVGEATHQANSAQRLAGLCAPASDA